MAYLIFCSFEVGGLPFRIAKILNKHGKLTYYISIHRGATGHDSTDYHHKDAHTFDWNLSGQFSCGGLTKELVVCRLRELRDKFQISGCLATGGEAWLLKEAGVGYCYWSYGSDLDQAPFLDPWPESFGYLRKMIYTLMQRGEQDRERVRYMKLSHIKSINNASSVIIAAYQYESLKNVAQNKRMEFFPHYFDVLEYDAIDRAKKCNKQLVREKIGVDRFFFSSTRHFWDGEHGSWSDNKGNDVILETFARYVHLTGDDEIKLVLVDKGPDVGSTKALAIQCGISDRIVWLGQMSRDELDIYYSSAIIAFGQFGNPVLTFSALEPIVQGTPCVTYFGDSMSSAVPFYQTSPPVLNTKSTADIASFLMKVISDTCLYEGWRYESWSWVRDNCSEKAFVDQIEVVFSNLN